MDETAILRAMARITHEIIERNQGAKNVCILGVKRRGVPLAKQLADNIKRFEGVSVPLGYIDARKYRDDISISDKSEIIEDSFIPCSLENKIVILVDDVLYTGRTARAAMEAIMKFGRAASIQFAVLVDRGHRELPIRGDYVGKNVPTSKN